MTNVSIYKEYDYIYLDELGDANAYRVPEGLVERYHLALLEWEAVQDELEEIIKG